MTVHLEPRHCEQKLQPLLQQFPALVGADFVVEEPTEQPAGLEPPQYQWKTLVPERKLQNQLLVSARAMQVISTALWPASADLTCGTVKQGPFRPYE